jgi:hypothetical protein
MSMPTSDTSAATSPRPSNVAAIPIAASTQFSHAAVPIAASTEFSHLSGRELEDVFALIVGNIQAIARREDHERRRLREPAALPGQQAIIEFRDLVRRQREAADRANLEIGKICCGLHSLHFELLRRLARWWPTASELSPGAQMGLLTANCRTPRKWLELCDYLGALMSALTIKTAGTGRP